MRPSSRAAALIWFVLCPLGAAMAQDLSPRAYVISPTRQNAVILTYSYLTGSLEFEGAVPITGATAEIHLPVIGYYRSLNFFGRSANLSVALPYGVGNFHGIVAEVPQHVYRSGLLDSTFRFSVNLKGGPAMPPQEFRKWQQKVLLGASLKVVAPTGQYDPTVLINWGNNRWAFKPEFGYSQRWGHWVLDGYAAVWFFTKNPEFFSHNAFVPGLQYQTQQPIGAFETHWSYDVKPRLWFSFDGNFWFGGKTSVNGVQNPLTNQRSSRVGVTGSIPLTNHQSLKASFSRGAYISHGGNYTNVSAAWQYTWSGWPRIHPP
jgi:outer membrane putative beta-barrel porin/alpha-amylase